MTAQSELVRGQCVLVTLTSNSYNSSVVDNNIAGLKITDLATNTAYRSVLVTGSNPSAAGVILPLLADHHVSLANACGASIYVKGWPADPNPLTILNSYVVELWCDGKQWHQNTAASSAIDLTLLSSAGPATDSDLMLLYQAGTGNHKLTLSALKTYLSSIVTTANNSPMLTQCDGVYVNNIASFPPTTLLATASGWTPVAGNRVLVAGQSSPSQNGPYTVVNGGPWTRVADLPAGSHAAGLCVPVVQNGYLESGTVWQFQCPPSADTVGTHALPLYQITANVSAVAGNAADVRGSSAQLNKLIIPQISGDEATARTNVIATLVRTPSITSKIVAANASNQIIEEVLLDTNGSGLVVIWRHQKATTSRACKKASYSSVQETVINPAGGTGLTVNIGQTDSFWAIHSGQIRLAVHCPDEGHDFSAVIPFSAVHALRMQVSNGQGSGGTLGMSSDRISADGSFNATWEPSAAYGAGQGSTPYAWPTALAPVVREPTIKVAANMSVAAGATQGQYYLSITFGGYTVASHSYQVIADIDVTAMDTAVGQN